MLAGVRQTEGENSYPVDGQNSTKRMLLNVPRFLRPCNITDYVDFLIFRDAFHSLWRFLAKFKMGTNTWGGVIGQQVLNL